MQRHAADYIPPARGFIKSSEAAHTVAALTNPPYVPPRPTSAALASVLDMIVCCVISARVPQRQGSSVARRMANQRWDNCLTWYTALIYNLIVPFIDQFRPSHVSTPYSSTGQRM